MAEWVKPKYPVIKKQAELEGRKIQWADEAGLKGHDRRGRGFALKGKTPARLDTPSYEKVNIIS